MTHVSWQLFGEMNLTRLAGHEPTVGVCGLTSRSEDHALVLGASMSGLLAARILADFYAKVTVVERDELPDRPSNRRGVPQGRHPHVLLARGTQTLAELFPGFVDEMVAAGAPMWTDGDLSKFDWSIGGHRLVRAGHVRNPSALAVYFPGRPLLEHSVRQRVRLIANVSLIEDHDVVEFTSTANRSRVTGTRISDRGTGKQTVLSADLVVDATGRGSRTPAHLESLGYGHPREDEVTIGLAYTSQALFIPREARPDANVARFPKPGRPTGISLIPNEGDTWMVGMVTMGGQQPPRQRADILAFLEKFAPAKVVAAVRAATPIGQVAYHRIQSNRWRRYDKMRQTPQGLLVIGDAICSFNPIYGQGITVAALEAMVLRQCLGDERRYLAQRFFRDTAKKISVAWQTAVSSDLAMPEVTGSSSRSIRIGSAYLDRVLTAAETDPVVTEQFLRVAGMVDSPARLLHPAFMLRIAKANSARHRAAVCSPE